MTSAFTVATCLAGRDNSRKSVLESAVAYTYEAGVLCVVCRCVTQFGRNSPKKSPAAEASVHKSQEVC